MLRLRLPQGLGPVLPRGEAIEVQVDVANENGGREQGLKQRLSETGMGRHVQGEM